jgi:ABC-2 type transport system ATP-binding protein
VKGLLRLESTSDDPAAIEIRDLRKRVARREVLRALNITVPRGAVYVLIGPNGSGKTTTLRLVQGLIRSDGGTSRVMGLDPTRDGSRLRAQVGYLAERHEWGYSWLTIENLFSAAKSYFPRWDADYAVRLAARLEVDRSRRYSECSKGEARRAQAILALAHRPPVLLLDEPTDGLDPLARAVFLSILAEHIATTEASVLVSTHLVSEFEGIADHVGIMAAGRLTLEAPLDQLRGRLRRYRAVIPTGWSAPPLLEESLVSRVETNRQIDWIVWGLPEDVRGHLRESGAAISEELPVSLEDTAVAFLARGERTQA